jgi:hypothetical protein
MFIEEFPAKLVWASRETTLHDAFDSKAGNGKAARREEEKKAKDRFLVARSCIKVHLQRFKVFVVGWVEFLVLFSSHASIKIFMFAQGGSAMQARDKIKNSIDLSSFPLPLLCCG